MNDIVKFPGGNLPATAEDLVAGLANISNEVKSGSGGTPFLRLLKTGVYAYGPENIEPEEGSLWAVNPYSVHHGWAAWGDGELIDEIMVPFNTPAPAKGTLQDYGVPWGQQFSVLFQCTTGEDKGQTVMYKGTSIGLHNAIKALIDAIVTRIQSDPKHIVPLIELNCDSYTHKKYGETFFPVLDIMDWVSIDDGESAGDDGDGEVDTTEDEPEEKPKKPAARRGKAKAKAKDDDDEKPTTARRRRRRAAS